MSSVVHWRRLAQLLREDTRERMNKMNAVLLTTFLLIITCNSGNSSNISSISDSLNGDALLTLRPLELGSGPRLHAREAEFFKLISHRFATLGTEEQQQPLPLREPGRTRRKATRRSAVMVTTKNREDELMSLIRSQLAASNDSAEAGGGAPTLQVKLKNVAEAARILELLGGDFPVSVAADTAPPPSRFSPAGFPGGGQKSFFKKTPKWMKR